MNRFALLAGITAGALTMSAHAVLAETWRMATKQPVDSPEGQVFEKFADLTEEYTDGNLKIQVYPNEQLGKEDAVLEQLQAGIVDIYAEGFSYMRKWAPELAWISAPFVFDDYDHWVRFMNTDLVKSWFDKAEAAVGVTPLGDPTAVLRGPYRVIVSNKPVNGLENVQGLKLRMHPDQLAISSWSNLGAEVITLPWTETYQAISKDIVQAVNSPVALVESMRFHEVAPHIARHDEYWQSVGFMMNKEAYEALDEDTKQGLLRAYEEAGAMSRELMSKVTDESIARMEKEGVTYKELDTEPFIEKMQSFYQQKAGAGELPEGFLEAVKATREAPRQ